MKAVRNIITILSISTTVFFAASCSEIMNHHFDDSRLKVIDPQGHLTRDDFRNMRNLDSLNSPPGADVPAIPDMIRTEPNVTAGVSEPPVPTLTEILAAPKPPKIGATQLVSLAVTDDVPLKDVLIELARLADVDIEVDAGITGGISFRAKDRPFNQVIERIADLAGLRYSINNGVLRVERDTPYIQTYTLDMLNIERNSQGSIGINSAGGGGGAAAGGGAGVGTTGGGAAGGNVSAGGTNSSNSNITQTSVSDFWEKFEDSVQQILAYTPVRMTSDVTIAPQPTTGYQNANQPTDPATAQARAQAAAAASVLDPDSSVALPPEPVAAPVAAAPRIPGAVPVATSAGTGTFYSLNRQAGTLTIAASERQHDNIKRFIDAIQKNATSQVLIEAKIVEVTLNDRYQSGINWSQFGNSVVSYSGLFDTLSATNPVNTPASFTVLSENLFGSSVDLSAAIRLLEEFGTARALSSPRINAMNNQQAVLTFAENLVYFKVNISVTSAVAGTGGSPGTPAQVDVSSEENRTPVGILLSLLPTINQETQEITLSVRPTLTRVTQFVTDPSFPIQVAVALSNLTQTGANADLIDKIRNTDSLVPQIETRELDSILKLKTGQVMVIGGLLEDEIIAEDSGVPAVSAIPYIGNLFKSVDRSVKRKELIIFIRATIVDSSGNATEADKALYEKFINEPNPLRF